MVSLLRHTCHWRHPQGRRQRCFLASLCT